MELRSKGRTSLLACGLESIGQSAQDGRYASTAGRRTEVVAVFVPRSSRTSTPPFISSSSGLKRTVWYSYPGYFVHSVKGICCQHLLAELVRYHFQDNTQYYKDAVMALILNPLVMDFGL